jgi:hypothetical protein
MSIWSAGQIPPRVNSSAVCPPKPALNKHKNNSKGETLEIWLRSIETVELLTEVTVPSLPPMRLPGCYGARVSVPGVYFPAVRVTVHRDGDPRASASLFVEWVISWVVHLALGSHPAPPLMDWLKPTPLKGTAQLEPKPAANTPHGPTNSFDYRGVRRIPLVRGSGGSS